MNRYVGIFLLWASYASAEVKIEILNPPEQGFFGKRAIVQGVEILAHKDVSDAAIEECIRRLDSQLGSMPEVSENLRRVGARMQIIGKDQQVTDLPMYRSMRGKPFEGKLTMDERGRGYGGLYCSCCEENLLQLAGDRWKDHRDICRHEFAHTILSFGLSPKIARKVEAQYRKSTEAGKWKTMYAATNPQEFFAELTMWYFGTRGDYGKLQPPPKPGVDWLKAFDPEAFELLDAIYKGQLKPDQTRIVDLTAHGLEDEGKLRSRSDQPATQVIFINRTDQSVERFWLDNQGKRKSYGKLSPGSIESQETYATHAWLLEGEKDGFLGIFVPDDRIGRIVIDPRPDKPGK